MVRCVVAGLAWGLAASSSIAGDAVRAVERRVDGLSEPVRILVDGQGVPTIEAASQAGAMYAQGWVHARDRLAQMDGIRRAASGRLAEIAGESALSRDIEARVRGMGRIADRVIAEATEEQRSLLAAYAAGVNASIARGTASSPEFLVLGTRPEPWAPRDSVLCGLYVAHALTTFLSGEVMLERMRRELPPELVSFLTPRTVEWDAPLIEDGSGPPPPPPMPTRELVERVRRDRPRPSADPEGTRPEELVEPEDPSMAPEPAGTAMPAEPEPLGSNNWAVSGRHTADGRALVANDMHLPLSLPNVWYRNGLAFEGVRALGVSLPGVPGLIIGTTEHIAWGVTNCGGDFLDLAWVDLERREDGTEVYRTADGLREVERREEVIAVRGRSEPVRLTVRETVWGPIRAFEEGDRVLAERWVYQRPGTFDLDWPAVLEARDVDEAVAAFRDWYGPALNVVIGDAGGRIAYILEGYLPRRIGMDGLTPIELSEHGKSRGPRWDGALDESLRPVVIDPPSGLLWTANNRIAPLAVSTLIGTEWAPPVRAHRIRELLLERTALGPVDERAMLSIQLDTRSPTHDAYRDLVLDVIPADAPGELGTARELVVGWSGRADTDDTGYPVLAAFRDGLRRRLLVGLLGGYDLGYAWWLGESSIRRIVCERPDHLLPEDVGSWRELAGQTLVDAYAAVRRRAGREPGEAPVTWGDVNRAAISHPLAAAIDGVGSPIAAMLGERLSAPPDPQPGHYWTVRVSGPSFGASQRMVVSPARWASAIFHMPGGQSGNPLGSGFLRGHDDWAAGRPSGLVPGPPVREVRLVPSGG